MTPEDERAFWDSLEGEEMLNNTAGFPPYDVDEVAQIIIDRLDAREAPRIGVLDLGCGAGRLTEAVARKTRWIIDGVDISPSLISQALSADGLGHYWVGDGRTLPFGTLFEHAYSVTMFQHIPPAAMWGYITQVHNRLPVGGRFVFTIAIGDEPASFLNHQIASSFEFGADLMTMFDTVEISPPDERGWTWITAQK